MSVICGGFLGVLEGRCKGVKLHIPVIEFTRAVLRRLSQLGIQV